MRKKHWYWGLFFVCMAVFIIVSQMGLLNSGISVWKVVLAGFLLLISIQALVEREFFGLFMPLAVIVLLFRELLGFPSLAVWPVLLAGLFLCIGCYILFPNKMREKAQGFRTHARNCVDGAFVNESIVSEDGSETCRVTFGESTKYIKHDAFRSARLSCSFGSLKVFFDQAKLHPDGAVVDVSCSFGSIELYVPRTWQINSNVHTALGDASVPPNGTDMFDGILTLRGEVSFGAVEIFYI